MDIIENNSDLTVRGKTYTLKFKSDRKHYVELVFDSGIGGELFVASGCDRDEMIDELISLDPPVVNESGDNIEIVFTGKTTLWETTEYVFTCLEEKVLYGYRVSGEGSLDNARFFEGFLKDDPRMNDAYYPYFPAEGRNSAYHRPVKDFMTSSKPNFDLVYSFAINASDKRCFMYYESTRIAVNCDRHYLGGDWLVTPPPFLYLLGNKDKKNWVSMGLAAKPGENNYQQYKYNGGEGFGLDLNYDGYTQIEGRWESPQIVFEQTDSGDEYEALAKYIAFLRETKCIKENDRSDSPRWWHEPIFGGWGEQVYHCVHWENYFKSQSHSWSGDSNVHCTRPVYEKMLSTLEEKELAPTILIVDNRWFDVADPMAVDEEAWPDMKGFIKNQHDAGRKVILWVSPWHYCQSGWGKNVPLDEHMIFDKENAFDLEINTDVFYEACNLEKRKTRITPVFDEEERHWQRLVDPFNTDYEKRLREKIDYLLSPEGLDADGFEFDYTHFVPEYRGTKPVQPHDKMHWGVELLHRILWIYHDQAKKAKSDALIISHTFNPYFNDVVDMLRLQDIYTDRKSIIPQMDHRAKMASIICPDCAIHTDQHPMPSLYAWREYMPHQPKIGNPALYYVTGIETTKEKFTEEDFAMLREVWAQHGAELDKKFGPKETK